MRVHVLHGPWREANSRAFFAPLFRARQEIRDCGLDLRFFAAATAELTDCDALLVDDKHFGDAWGSNQTRILDQLDQFAAATRLVYCDLGDSSGLLRIDALVRVHAYWKGYLLRDRQAYGSAHYGGRLYTDHFHATAGVTDSSPLFSTPLPANHAHKLKLAWGYGLARHGWLSGWGSNLFARLPLPQLLGLPIRFARPGRPRSRLVSCRMGFRYGRETVAHQRQLLRTILAEHVPASRVGRRAFFAELKQSQLVASPFGWGEFAYRDYEAFIAGAALLKPAMSHLETYPDYYQPDHTMIALRWDLADLADKVAWAAGNPRKTQEIATFAQNLYNYHVTTAGGRRDLAKRLLGLLRDVAVAVSARPEFG